MILILCLIIIANSAVIAYLLVNKRKVTAMHAGKVASLQSVIIELLNDQKEQHEKIKLADELKEAIRNSNSKLSRDIVALQFDFFEILKKNNLLE
ncbi:hypothetical protein [Flavobacterium sp. 3HN19-14]|uniref:hypothetical protein n=1 Tax=Flavobacterium sp. 3HN19-14 TaxID=3448133 RepID=UPI003EE1111A